MMPLTSLIPSAPSLAHARSFAHRLKAVPTWAAARTLSQDFGPLAIFLPSAGREGGAALLRIYNVADGLRALGWRTLVLPCHLTLGQRRQVLNSLSADVIVMQGARHRLNRPWLYPEWACVLDMDDADFHLDHLAEPLARAMPHVKTVIAGSEYVADWCRRAGAGADVVWTGAPVSLARRPEHAQRPPVIAWAQTRPMTYVREADMVRRVAAGIAARHPGGVTLRLYDRTSKDTQAFADSFRAPGLTVEWVKKTSFRDYLASFDDVSLGLAPLSEDTPFSRGKSFGKVLAYLDRMVPVLASDACEHGRFFTSDIGFVSNVPEAWITTGTALLAQPEKRQTMAEAAFWAFQSRLSIEAASARVDLILRRVLAQTRLTPAQRTAS